jgi:hypothetical protein
MISIHNTGQVTNLLSTSEARGIHLFLLIPEVTDSAIQSLRLCISRFWFQYHCRYLLDEDDVYEANCH